MPTIYEWRRRPWMQALLVVDNREEMYGTILWEFLPSMDIPSIHGWQDPTNGMHHRYVNKESSLEAIDEPSKVLTETPPLTIHIKV